MMGRLLRKKDPTKKVKKAQSADKVGGELDSPTAQGKPQPAVKKPTRRSARPRLSKKKILSTREFSFSEK
jgi:preprotein translocase subunit SecE